MDATFLCCTYNRAADLAEMLAVQTWARHRLATSRNVGLHPAGGNPRVVHPRSLSDGPT